jgi:hypothetical protein
MSEFTQGILIALIPALIVAIISPIITIRLSMGRFFRERWWEEKRKAYSHLIEHLSYLQLFYGEWCDQALGLKKIGEKDQKRLSEGYRQAKESLKKAAATGSYIISDDAANTIESLLRELEAVKNKRGDWFSVFDESYGAVKECITKVRESAKTDLRK